MSDEHYIVIDIETLGLNPWCADDRITCICLKTSDGKEVTIIKKDEAELLQEFYHVMDTFKRAEWKIITKNGIKFDLPYIFARTALHTDFNQAHLSIMDFEHEDLQLWTKKWISLDDLARIFKMVLKNGNGLQAIKLWHDGQTEALAHYCMNDVRLTEKIYLKRKALEDETHD